MKLNDPRKTGRDGDKVQQKGYNVGRILLSSSEGKRGKGMYR